ncbi:hypothetical protein Ccrd_013052 [Cynara cardunculus var. scolymus]|uniref:Ubiquitin-like protease family profile domain-containing protein n=1 Tax=Cynara cardunculus var. scolymus TaxID=59895 RepID=A0A103YGF5_CYNCS|nr:hypothetical protein Ccrd_013052 [Cynara cardunculus var. scolymus]
MTINGVPSKLGFYVVDNLDVKKMELKVVNGGIPITIESIHKLLGLRMGGVGILEMDEVEDSKNMTATWKKQFDKKKMRPKDIMKIIQSSGDAGFNFKLNFLLLYVEETRSPKVVVEHKGHAISAWNLDLLKKRQSTWIKDRGLGLLPLRSNVESSEDVHHCYASNQENIGETSTPTHLNKEILIKIAVVLSARVEAEMEIKEAMSKFPDDEEFKQYKKQLDDMFNEGACNTTHDTHSNGLKDHSTAKNDGQPSLDIVVSQPSGFNLPKIWLSPGFIEAVDKVVENTISTSKTKRSYATITPPKFDLGISPIKQSEPLSMVLHEEAECIERCPSVERCNVSEDAKKYQEERATRRELKLGDHLRSPFVIIVVDLNVTPEEKSMNGQWLGLEESSNELLFSTPNDTKLHRHAIESLERTTTIYVSVIDAWATLLNYEEWYRNRDSLRRYFFNTEVMQRLMIRHLNTIGHASGKELDETGQERLRLDWQTQYNFDDCGVFTMRHMETYMGDMKSWKTRLAPESKTQENQIANLRMKYVAKILVNNYPQNEIRRKDIGEQQ